MSQECTTDDCRNFTSTYLCSQCVSDLQQWLDRVPDMREELFVTMARLDAIAPRNSGGGGGTTEAPAAVNHGAMDVRYALAVWEGQDARKLAEDKFAGGFLPLLQELLAKAERIIDLPTETWSATCTCGETVVSEFESATCVECGANNRKSTLNAAKARKVAMELVTAKGLAQWIHTYTGHVVTENQIYIWANRGQIPQAQKKPPLYDPLAVAVSKGLYKRAI